MPEWVQQTPVGRRQPSTTSGQSAYFFLVTTAALPPLGIKSVSAEMAGVNAIALVS